MPDETRFVLLPGLDGTGTLFRRFVALAPEGAQVTTVAFPRDRALSFDELVELVLPELPDAPFVLVGESFSGPLALRVAKRRRPAGVVLCASLVRAPALHRFSSAPLSFLLSARPRTSLVRVFLSGGDEELAKELVSALSSVEREVVASRIRMTLEVNAVPDISGCPCAVAYLRATNDRLVSARQADIVREARSDALVEEVEGPHLLLQSNPEECWRRIHRFAEQAGTRVVVRRAELSSEGVDALIAELNAELLQLYPEEGGTHFRLDPAEVSEGRGAFLIASVRGEPVGCGAVRLNDPGTAEIKRMYVAAAMRGRGIARRLLEELEAQARLLGAKRIVLETGDRQPHALALYGRAGFVRIERFGEYVDSPLSVCMQKNL